MNQKMVSLNENKNAIIFFWFNSDCIKVPCTFNSKMIDVFKNFANYKGMEYNSFYFRYENNELEKDKTFKEIANQRDVNRRAIDIYVNEKVSEEKSGPKRNKKKILIISIIIAITILIALIILLIVLLLKKRIVRRMTQK